MNSKRKLIVSALVLVMTMCAIVLCVRHYGMDVRSYYIEELENLSEVMRGTYQLEEDTVIEQAYKNRAPYMVGVDLILLGIDQESDGTLFVQLCDESGNVLAQKREEIQQIEAGQFYKIRFLKNIDVHAYENLVIRIFAESSNCVPELVTVASEGDPSGSTSCSLDGETVQNNLAINYVYGQMDYIGYEWKDSGTKQALLASIVLITLCALTAIYIVYNKERIDLRECFKRWKKYDNLKQVFYILWFFCIFLAASAISRIRNNQSVPLGVYIYIAVIIGVSIWYFRTAFKGKGWKQKKSILNDKGALIVVLLSTIVRIPLFLQIQLLDGAIYYGVLQQVCKEFEYSLAYIWENFRLAGHYAIAYTFFASIGEFLFPDYVTGVLIIMLVLTDCALLCVYKMFRGYWLELPPKEAAIGTMFVSVCPLFLGLFSDVSLEHLLFVFTIFLFYAEYKEQKLMTMIWLVAIMLTKETGLVIAAGYLFVHICIHLKESIKHKGKDKIQFFLSGFPVVCSIVALAIVCLITIKQNGLFIWFGMNKKDGLMNMDYGGKIMEVTPLFLQKLKLFFVLHFEWIPVLMILLCFLYCTIKRQRIHSFKGQASFLSTLGAFILVNLFLVRFLLGRYHIFSAVMTWMLAWILLLEVFPNCLNHFMHTGTAIAIIAVLVIQNFYFIDPLTNLAFEKYETGKGKMISTEVDGGNLGDTFSTNFRHTFLYGLIDVMLEDSDFGAGTWIIVPYKKDYLHIHDYVGYDICAKRMVPCSIPDEEEVITIEHALLGDIQDGSLEKVPERGIMYFLPYTESDEQEAIKKAEQFYEVSERREIENWGGKLAYYILEKK